MGTLLMVKEIICTNIYFLICTSSMFRAPLLFLISINKLKIAKGTDTNYFNWD